MVCDMSHVYSLMPLPAALADLHCKCWCPPRVLLSPSSRPQMYSEDMKAFMVKVIERSGLSQKGARILAKPAPPNLLRSLVHEKLQAVYRCSG